MSEKTLNNEHEHDHGHDHDNGHDDEFTPGHDHPVAMKFTIDKYMNFLNDLATDDDFREALENDPIPALRGKGIEIEKARESELKTVIKKGLPPKFLVDDHLMHLERHWDRDTKIMMAGASELLNRLAEDDEFREKMEQNPAQTLQEYGVDVSNINLPENVTLPGRDEIRRARLGENVRTDAVSMSAALRYHFNLEWHLLTTGGRFYGS